MIAYWIWHLPSYISWGSYDLKKKKNLWHCMNRGKTSWFFIRSYDLQVNPLKTTFSYHVGQSSHYARTVTSLLVSLWAVSSSIVCTPSCVSGVSEVLCRIWMPWMHCLWLYKQNTMVLLLVSEKLKKAKPLNVHLHIVETVFYMFCISMKF